jgi:hypothetical protein
VKWPDESIVRRPHPEARYVHLRGVWRLVLIDALTTAVLLSLWYLYFARYNRRRGVMALRRACAGQCRIVEAHWFGACRLQARLHFAAQWFEDVRVTVRLLPRPLPLQWLSSLWSKSKETLTFEADLDYAPSFHLEVFRHRWLTNRQIRVAAGSRDWGVCRPGPVVLTTRTDWTQELTPVVNSLINSRGYDLLSVRFGAESPHLVATVALEALSDEHAAAGFLGVMRELAAGASTHRHKS